MTTNNSWFGPNKDEIWRQLASEIGANMVEGDFWNGSKLQATVGPWTVTLDSYVILINNIPMTYTRMRAPFVNQDGLRFQVTRRGMFSGLAKRLGAQDITIGAPTFDDAFVIKGTREEQIRAVLSDATLQELLLAQPDLSITIEDNDGWFGTKIPERVDIIQFLSFTDIRELERLKSLFEIFAILLERLYASGSAERTDPGVQL